MKIIKGLLLMGTALAAAVVLAGCSFGFISVVHYTNADKYTAGDREITEKIDSIDIDYISGDITFLTEDTDTVSVKETARIALDSDRQVHTWVEGSTLHVRYCAADKRLDLSSLDKKLEITVPEDVTFSDVNINLSSGDLRADDIKTKKLDVDSTSGNHVIGCTADTVTINSTSGDIDLTQFGKSEDISVEATSGNFHFNMEEVKNLILNTTSGDMWVEAEKIEKLDVDSTSGNKTFTLSNCPEETVINASSGDVELRIPSDSGVTAILNTTSGDIRSNIPFTTNGDTYTFNSGTAVMDIDTTSGKITINALD